MATSNMLLHLIADLQGDVTVKHGRRTLLEYAQTSSGARLALLFVLDKDGQTLRLLERCGRRRGHQRDNSPPGSHAREEPLNPKRISSAGLFGSTLHKRGLLHIPHPYTDARTLQEELYWIGPNDAVILGTIGEQRGVLALCFGRIDKTQLVDDVGAVIDEGNLLVCTTLLSAYLSSRTNRARGSRATTRVPSPPSSSPAPTRATGYTEAPLERGSRATEYEAQLKAAIDQERSRIARDIHDGAAQNIAHVLHKLEYIQRVLVQQPEVALRELGRTADVLKESLHDLRHAISSLMPVQLEELGFDAALQALLDEYTSNELALKISYERDDFKLLPLSLEATVFRFIQEALNNVRKHAQASQVTICIRLLAGLLLVEVSDNGRGFHVEQAMRAENARTGQHIGLRAMRKRVQQAGGQWELQSQPGEGTTVKARFLLAPLSAVLTLREREVLQLLVEGLTNRAIAEELSVSAETIKSHVHHIMQKMQARDRTQAAVLATKQQWL